MKTRLLLYCTKNKWRLFFDKVKQVFTLGKVKSNNDLNGKIVAECDFEVEEIYQIYGSSHPTFDENGLFDDYIDYVTDTLKEEKELLKKSCLSLEEIEKYNPNYAIHIKNLHIFDEPIKLEKCHNDDFSSVVNYAPQNMMRVIDWNGETKILISIQPQWMCLILNRIKDVEVRRVVLKEMLKNE